MAGNGVCTMIRTALFCAGWIVCSVLSYLVYRADFRLSKYLTYTVGWRLLGLLLAAGGPFSLPWVLVIFGKRPEWLIRWFGRPAKW